MDTLSRFQDKTVQAVLFCSVLFVREEKSHDKELK